MEGDSVGATVGTDDSGSSAVPCGSEGAMEGDSVGATVGTDVSRLGATVNTDVSRLGATVNTDVSRLVGVEVWSTGGSDVDRAMLDTSNGADTGDCVGVISRTWAISPVPV